MTVAMSTGIRMRMGMRMGMSNGMGIGMGVGMDMRASRWSRARDLSSDFIARQS